MRWPSGGSRVPPASLKPTAVGAMMDHHSTLLKMRRALFRNGLAIAAATVALLSITTPSALAADDTVAAQSAACLACHGVAGMEKKLANGDVLPLHVPADSFSKSVHNGIGCASCHGDIDVAAHPPSTKEIASARSYAVVATQACRGCHMDVFEEWETSIHAALVRRGSPAAPICSNCHDPHAVVKNAATTREHAPCKNCHTEIFAAYAGSVHAKSRAGSEQSYAPICSGCHSAHAVKPTVAGESPGGACLGCHAGVLEAHQKWLPNAALHFDAVSCPACHAAGAQRKVDLMLIDSQSKARRTEQIGVPLFDASARSDGKGIDAMTLWNLLQTFNREGMPGRTALRGRLEVRTGPQAHQLADKSRALSDCRTCHSAGSDAFQSVTISLVGSDGRRIGYGANADVLHSMISLDSVSGFYAIGGTRIKLLDILLIAALVGGVGIAVGHSILGWIFKLYGFSSPPHGEHGPKPS